MIKFIKISSLLVLAMFLNSCASGYQKIAPETIKYGSKNIKDNIILEYKYDLLEKKYQKKELKNGIKLVAVKITNNTDRDITYGKDFKISYLYGRDIYTMTNENLFKTIKQSPASYLWYLLLTPVQFYAGTTTTSNGYYTETKPATSFPIGLFLGPGLTGTNMIVASSANKKLKTDLKEYEIYNKTIAKGQTVYGLIGLKSNSSDSLEIVLLNN